MYWWKNSMSYCVIHDTLKQMIKLWIICGFSARMGKLEKNEYFLHCLINEK